MAVFTTSSQRPPATLYQHADLHTPADIFSHTHNTVSPAPESLMLSLWPGPPLQYGSRHDSVARPQSLPEPRQKRQIESVGELGGGSFPTSSSKKPRTFKRSKNAIREIPGFACPLYKRSPSQFGGPRGCADWCTLEIHRLYSDHLKKHAKEGDVSYATVDAVKKLKPCVNDSNPEVKAAARWSLTYRYLHNLASGDKIPSPYYHRPEASFERPSHRLAPGPESSESSRHEAEQQDVISHLSSSPPPDQVASCHSDRSTSQSQHLPGMRVEHQPSTRAGERVSAAAPLLRERTAVVDTWDAGGRTALMQKAEGADQASARLLLEWRAAANVADEFGRTALLRVVEQRDHATARLLLELGAAVDVQDAGGRTPLSLAVEKGDEVVVKLLLERGAGMDVQGMFEQTPLSLAAERGDEAVVKLLLERGAAVDVQDMFGRTPLSSTAGRGNEAVANLLLERGAVADVQDSLGRTPLGWAACMGCEAVAKLLLARDDADPDSKDTMGQTPLSEAALGGHTAVAQLLLARDDVDPDSKDTMGQTPLSLAALSGHMAVVKVLLERGAAVDVQDKYGETPVSWAAKNGHEAVVELLIAKGNANHSHHAI